MNITLEQAMTAADAIIEYRSGTQWPMEGLRERLIEAIWNQTSVNAAAAEAQKLLDIGMVDWLHDDPCDPVWMVPHKEYIQVY